MAKEKSSSKQIKSIEMESVEAPKKTLGQIAAKINTKFGKAKAELGSKKKSRELIPTGILPLDYRLRGGFPRGRIVFLAGAESSWKSTICLNNIARVQKIGGTAAYIDAERTFDPKWAQLHGVDLENLLVLEPDTAEEAFNQMTMCILEGIDVVVLDSLNALSVKKEMFADDKGTEAAGIETEAMGVMQRKTSQWLRNNTGRIAKSNTLLLVIGQLRENINAGMYGNPNVITGGRAIKFYSSIILLTRQLLGKTNEIRDENDEVVGKKFEFKFEKNKLGRDGVTDGFDAYGHIIDNYQCMLKIGQKEGFIIRVNNTTYQVNGKNFKGKQAVIDALVDDSTGLYEWCEKELQRIMGSNIYVYDPYQKAKEKAEAAAVVVNEDDDGVLIPEEDLENGDGAPDEE